MNKFRAIPSVVKEMAARNGRTLEMIGPAILKQVPATDKHPEIWTVDLDHEAWTGIPDAVRDAIAALPASPSDRWRLLHARSRSPVVDKVAELLWIKALATGMNGSCECASHWAELLTDMPPTIDTPADYETWAVAAHNAVNKRLEYPILTLAQARKIHATRRPTHIARRRHRFAYFTGSTRPGEGDRIAAMIRSARNAGVAEDFHVFAVERVPGAINHRISADRSWKNHMAKVELLSELAHVTGRKYDAFVWLDSDSWFVRDPGDMRALLRDNPIWVGMECDLRQTIQGDWYGMQVKGTPSVYDVLIDAGARPDCLHGVNGGMWIVRREAVAEFHTRMFAASEFFGRRGYPHATNDEPPLAVLGSTMVRDPELNTIDKWSHIWACDWVGRWTDRLPDGRPWVYKDWGTQRETGEINPAIVHNMRGKHLMK